MCEIVRNIVYPFNNQS